MNSVSHNRTGLLPRRQKLVKPWRYQTVLKPNILFEIYFSKSNGLPLEPVILAAEITGVAPTLLSEERETDNRQLITDATGQSFSAWQKLSE
jgi:hypothetical protein